MSLWSATGLALVHGVTVAAVATALARPIRALLAQQSNRIVWIVLLLPLLTPALVVGYATQTPPWPRRWCGSHCSTNCSIWRCWSCA